MKCQKVTQNFGQNLDETTISRHKKLVFIKKSQKHLTVYFFNVSHPFFNKRAAEHRKTEETRNRRERIRLREREGGERGEKREREGGGEKVKRRVYNLHIFGKYSKFPVTTGATVGGISV